MAGDTVWLWAAFLGLLVGSFANVVIHRLPRMMQRQWDQEARQWLSGQDNDGNRDADPTACESPTTWPDRLRIARLAVTA